MINTVIQFSIQKTKTKQNTAVTATLRLLADEKLAIQPA